MSEVGGDDVGPSAGLLDLFRDVLQLRLGAGSNHHVSTRFGERDGNGSAKAAARAGHYGYLVVESESVQNHVCLTRLVLVVVRHVNKIGALREWISRTRSN
ncbi:hypothetical protein MAUB1S_02622 [Mycolicibacterium aubagnense]